MHEITVNTEKKMIKGAHWPGRISARLNIARPEHGSRRKRSIARTSGEKTWNILGIYETDRIKGAFLKNAGTNIL